MLAIASDHNGFELKEQIIQYFKNKLNIQDLGCFNKQDKVDYPDYASAVCNAIAEEQVEFGVLICKAGIGMSIAANRKEYIRAAVCSNITLANIARQKYDANILVLASDNTSPTDAIAMLEVFINAKFEGGKHARRLEKIC
ncbi:MAG: ribose 5-phosphate isomerase B [Rickettsiaceae bacterium]|nr:ribose 5-phosphate isomerase B [Rickettsiaceae bacterium]